MTAIALQGRATTRRFSEKTGERTGPSVLTVIIPCLNEEEVLPLTYARIKEVLGGRDFRLELLLVDDGSSDRTPIIASELANQDSSVRVLLFSRNFGHQAAVSAGLANASGDAIVVIDADLQDPPEVVLEMIEHWRAGSDVVYGIRTKRKEGVVKKFCYSLFYKTFQSLANIDAPLDAGDFSLIDRQVLNAINQLPEKNRFYRGLRAWSGFRQSGVTYERAHRAAGESKYPLIKLIGLAKDGIFNFSTVPLTLVFYIGLSMSVLSFVTLVFVLVLRIFNIPLYGMRASDVQGFSSTILTILLIGGIQLVCTGVLGEYIGRIYQEIKGRPTYVLKTRVGNPNAYGCEVADISARTGDGTAV